MGEIPCPIHAVIASYKTFDRAPPLIKTQNQATKSYGELFLSFNNVKKTGNNLYSMINCNPQSKSVCFP